MTSPALLELERLHLGFRRRYLTHDEITEQLSRWQQAFPSLVQVREIGTSHEGRPLSLLVLGPEPERKRPTAWVDGNMHAQELCGSSVALAIAEDVLSLHLDRSSDRLGLPPHVLEVLREVRFFVLPRMSPDGAEHVLRTGAYVRSNPRDRRPHARTRWVCQDIDGDGVALLMRKIDPSGEFVASKDVPELLVPRTLEDEGPYYKVYPEGLIEPFDGLNVPDPHFLSDNDTDLNRNFPHSWRHEPEQEGAGVFPASEPEARAVVELSSAHPEIFAWLNLHTFGGVYIRPLGHQPDRKMDPFDLSVFRQIEAWGEDVGGYPTVSGFEEFLYEPEKPLHGDLSDFAYHQRGAIAFVCELWDFFRQIGTPRVKPFVDHYSRVTRDDLLRFARWDKEHNQGRALRPWVPFSHPQLGEVEVGGLDPRVGVVNPSYEKLPEVCERQSRFYLRVAAMAPRLHVADPVVEALGADTYAVDVTVQNRGYLPTYVLGSAKALPWNEPVHAEATPSGCTLVEPVAVRREIGHLEGWGQGLFGSMSANASFQRSRGSVSSRTLRWIVRGEGTLRLRVGSCRVGFTVREVLLGGPTGR
jgi:hypothetical protein